MIKIRELERAVSKLPPKELGRFRSWFAKFDSGYLKEFKAAIEKIRRGEKELRNGKTKIVHSLAELR